MPTKVNKLIKNSKIYEKTIIMIGDTKAGKTTLLYYLAGLKLIRKENSNTNIVEMVPE
jgi:hypothetical protein